MLKREDEKNCVDKFVRYRSINKDLYVFVIAYLFSAKLHIKVDKTHGTLSEEERMFPRIKRKLVQ